jgi:putative ATP-binding cassette transporter
MNGMNVLNSYVSRDFMSSIEARNVGGFQHYAWLYIGVFATSTVIGMLLRFCEERLALLWREWQTRAFITSYFTKHIYLHLKQSGSITNPDQRISEDIRTLATSTLSFLLMLLNGTFTAISFSSVLWLINPRLFGVAVVYAAMGSALTIWLGRPLIRLNYQQADREADFRADLISVHHTAEGIAFSRDENRTRDRLLARVDHLVENFRRVITINRNLNFFSGGYNYLIQLIPALLIAPLFMRGKVEFGVIAQSTMAFATLVGAFSLIITQFQSISSYATVIARVGELLEASRTAAELDEKSLLKCEMSSDDILYQQVSFRAEGSSDQMILRELNARFSKGIAIVITGSNQAAKHALFQATAGFGSGGSGEILRPPPEKIAFLQEQPYLSQSSLRQLFTPVDSSAVPSDEEIAAALDELKIDLPLDSPLGFDTTHDWEDELPLRDKQLLAVARALISKPDFTFLDHPDSSLSDEDFATVLGAMKRRKLGCAIFENGTTTGLENFDASLELHADGTWKWTEPSYPRTTLIS